MRRPVALGDAFVEDEIGRRPFGTSVDDFTRLCRNVAWDYPAGLVLINLDRNRCLVFSAAWYTSCPAPLFSALKWMQTTPGTFGLTVRATPEGTAQCELFAVLLRDEHGDAHLSGRAERLLRLVRSWS